MFADGRYGWDGGYGTTWSNVPSEDLTVVVLAQRAADETGLPSLGDDVLATVRQPAWATARVCLAAQWGIHRGGGPQPRMALTML